MAAAQVDIHPTALVDPKAVLDEGVQVGAYAWVGPRVRLGAGTIVHHHATVDGATTLGPRNEVHPYAYVGAKTQDLKYKGGWPPLDIGEGNVFREFCTVHGATFEEGLTKIGAHNHFLAYTHVGHDCRVGDHCVFSNNATLAGHTTVENHVVLGGFVGVHQFCRVGSYCMIGGCSKVVKDIAPFLLADGDPAEVRGHNKVGMERHGFSEEEIALARHAWKILYHKGLNRRQALDELSAHEAADGPVLGPLLAFARESERGLA